MRNCWARRRWPSFKAGPSAKKAGLPRVWSIQMNRRSTSQAWLRRPTERWEATGAGILDCRTALEATQGNLEAATALLQEKGLAAAAKRADRETHNGVLDL